MTAGEAWGEVARDVACMIVVVAIGAAVLGEPLAAGHSLLGGLLLGLGWTLVLQTGEVLLEAHVQRVREHGTTR
ncbi:hypothetical protein [Streptomonospora litoralis]|uniref:Uncharacterized protein n=1 Tax=Streptomonospora litoralis TaxID=2498135 RepID=A0A4P6QAH7_9ACTN|nr:hypothetical protein [Streptomonospora litoralis]QBI56751.1 hypothetical protein EKD16_25050 [Streptomonospora litoralis]